MLRNSPLSRLPVALAAADAALAKLDRRCADEVLHPVPENSAPAFRARQLIAEYRAQLSIEHAEMARWELIENTATRLGRVREAKDAKKRGERAKDCADATEATVRELVALYARMVGSCEIPRQR